MTTRTCTTSDLHPYECDHDDTCDHCARRRTDTHDPNTCQLCDASTYTYRYRVVTSNGAGIHTGLYRRCADAKAAAERIVERERARTVKLGPYEIERVQLLDYGGHRYWMRRGSQWVPWDPNEDETVRRPDWIYGDPREEESDVAATVLVEKGRGFA